MDLTQFRRLKYELEELIDERELSLHFYNLGDSYKKKKSI
ncbi:MULTISPECIES: CRISPR-associated endonuclease Cas2 [Paenibacillus]|nr:CRISPR-associated endonuclease Cas2 [Paenibacillus peoriae]